MPFVPERLDAHAKQWLERGFVLGVLFLVVGGVMIPESVFAQDSVLTTTINYILVILAKILEVLLNFFGSLVLLFVDMIISVAQYNDFVNAKPVEAGWPLVRDVVNMFFIVILLVTAFSTIIQYKKFQYKQVLPKLLLMAVLVNFSKTFIGLLIDLSQVIMLTFVNGFQAAAAGNFVSALKLDKVLTLATAGTFSDAANNPQNELNLNLGDSFLLKIVMAEMLGMFLLGVSLITLIIMLLYLVFRVVGLWIALILSPAAFFATALESTPLSKGVAFIAGNFWPRLGALLTGGPIMAFFLWLTLATVQTGGFGDFTKLEGSARQAEQAQIGYFATTVGNAQEVATFFVAIMMLMLGLDAALSIATQVSSTLGNAGQRIRSTGMAATRFAAYGGLAMGGAAAGRGLGRAGRAGARFVDSRADISGKAGWLAQRVGQSRLVPSVIGDPLATMGGKMRGTGGERRKEFEKRYEATFANMDPGEEIARLKKEATSFNKNKAKAAQNRLGKLMTSKPGVKALKDQYKEEGMKKHELKEGAELDAYADLKTREDTAQQFAEFSKLAEETQDKDMLEKRDDTLEKRPDYLEDTDKKKAFSEHMDKLIGKGAQHVAKNVSSDAWQDSRTLDYLKANTDIWDEKNGDWNKDSDWYKKLVKPGGSRKEIFETHKEALIARAGAAGPRGLKEQAAQAKPQVFYVRKDGKWSAFDQTKLKEPGKSRGRAKRRQEDRIEAAQERVGKFREEVKGLPEGQRGFRVESMRQAQYDGMSAGAGAAQMYGVDEKGAFATDIDKKNYETNTKQFMAEGAADHKKYQSLDMSDLDKNPEGKNDLRSAFVATADVGQMDEAWQKASIAKDEASQEQIRYAAKVVHQEGMQVEKKVANWNQKHADAPIDTQQVITAGRGNNQQALTAAVQNMPENEKITMEQARALAHKEDVNKMDLGKFLEGEMSKHAEQAYTRATQRPPRTPQGGGGNPPAAGAAVGGAGGGAGAGATAGGGETPPAADPFQARDQDRDDS